jgi:FKBP-type peptidyl-prolyl cis-trans isomerase FklB
MRLRTLTVLAALAFAVALGSACNNRQQRQGNDAGAGLQAPGTDDLSAPANARFLRDNAAKEGVQSHATGLQYRVLKAGQGASPQSGEDTVTVTYTGRLIDGTVFDQTAAGRTAEFQAGTVIPGWVIALSMMKEGDEWELVIPAELGYGAQGSGKIPPNQTLVFRLALQKVTPAP